MVSRAIKLCGTDIVDPPTRVLRAGPLSVELDNGALRYVRFGGTEVLRAIAFLVRDENWGTFTPEIRDLVIEEAADRFTVRYSATCSDDRRRLSYEAAITGQSDGSLSFEAIATPETDVVTNRTGFIVLHPVEGVAGYPVRVAHVDGREEQAVFPDTIDPMCPFQGIRSLSHQIAPNLWATCTMQGDAFEMEDQRNWSDASYKTYVRPLAEPWPYTLPNGEPIRQSVTLSISRQLPSASSKNAVSDGTVAIAIGQESGTMPAIGIGVPAEEAPYALERLDLLKRLAPKWLVCQVDLRQGHGCRELELYRDLGQATGAEIVLEIITRGSMAPQSELSALATEASEAGLKPDAVAVFLAQHMKSVLPGSPWPEMPSFEELYSAARAAFPGARLGGGMATYFTELNRKRPPAALLDYVTHTTCPSVHAADDRSVMETLESLPYQIRSTRAFMGHEIGYRIGPSQLGCRENAYGNATAPNEGNARVCLSRIDPRQRGLFNAAWSLGYIARLARDGVEAVALGAPSGPFGFVYRRCDFAQPYFDDVEGAVVYPAFHVVAGLSQAAGAQLFEVESSARGKVDGLAVRRSGKTELWLSNLTDQDISILLPTELANAGRISTLDAAAFERLTSDPNYLDKAAGDLTTADLQLDAYSVARIELA
ncbi:hypothetical protein SAZ10_19535 [Mesorhizobium sp. BAC0120]|uniref:hypothetical protein n=1 Tax=Mesorhizobium sp. BAC0120 TaxID=3090670 RepID=UPI00298C51F1|nr:hypothetical protein [Mesorhizobium sp. BAC0120]MDW6023943.1 hypothetical protein [Mesorhizobium sp. BAC0120]